MKANVYLFSPSNWRLSVVGAEYQQKRVQSVYEWGGPAGADLCFNLGLFDLWDGPANGCYARSNGRDISYGGKSEVIAFNSVDACGGYSNGVINGVVKVNKYLTSPVATAYRTGVGQTSDGQFIVAQSRQPLTETAFCTEVNNFVRSLGKVVSKFVLEDGGGSTSEWSFMSGLGYFPSSVRKVATVLCVKLLKKPKFTRTLSKGMTGSDVMLLQTALGGIEADGIFGNGTRARVIAAQRALGIAADGYAGPITMSKLFK